MIATRKFFSQIAKGNLTSGVDVLRPIFRMVDSPERRLIIAGAASGYVILGAGESYVIPLPKGYASTTRLYAQFRPEGTFRVVTTGPSHPSSTTLMKGLAGQAGQYAFTGDKVTGITVTNPTATAASFAYAMFPIPDLTVSTSFFGTAATMLIQPPADGSSAVTSTQHAVVANVRNDYTSTAVTTGAWLPLILVTTTDINRIMIFDSSGRTMELGIGAAGSEQRLALIPPGGWNQTFEGLVSSGARLSLRAVSGDATTGEIDLVCLT